ncbi:MAG: hypothetical protein M1836_005528 [Candelina mexicana]|nr:MAG: hypothetical protein M1836_005528 [Candelina mexicana]
MEDFCASCKGAPPTLLLPPRPSQAALPASSHGDFDRSQSGEHLRTVCATLTQQLLLAQARQSGHCSPKNDPEVDPTLPTLMAPSATPTIDNFLSEISRVLQDKDGVQLQAYLVIEPPLPAQYTLMVMELRKSFPAAREDALDNKCNIFLQETDKDGERGGSWSGFMRFLKLYFGFLRDVDVQNLLETQQMLAELVSQSISALGHGGMGVVILPTVIAFSRTLARLTVGLDNRPELTAQWVRRQSVSAGEDGESRLNIVEDTAEKIREGFKTCLNERTSGKGVSREGRPEGKKGGIYLMANLCLKLYFQCHKTGNATMMFINTSNQSPPLSVYPASQRVTYLYYLGRFLFSNNHFYRAQLALQAAYNQCHARCIQQRRRIAIYLITTNIIVGRFPSPKILQRPEAEGLGARFLPICTAIAKGDLARFHQIFYSDAKDNDWFIRMGIFLPMRNRCEVLVWRSLARKTFILSGFHGDDSSKRAANLDIHQLQHLTTFLERRATAHMTQSKGLTNGTIKHTNAIFLVNNEPEYVDPDLEGMDEPSSPLLPGIADVESMLSSLISQGLLTGYISHRLSKFVILGASKNAKGAMGAGFPNVWEVIRSKSDDEVPGWVQDDVAAPGRWMGKMVGAGMVVNLTGARPAGSAPL